MRKQITLLLFALMILASCAKTPDSGLLTDSNWSAISVSDASGTTYLLSSEDAQRVYQILSSMDTKEVLTPSHEEGQFSDPMFIVFIEYAEMTEKIYSSETGRYFFRYTNTSGTGGELGYVGGFSEELYNILSSYVSDKLLISVDYATDEILSTYDTYIDEYVSYEYSYKIIFKTNTKVNDFKFIEVEYKDNTFYEGATLYEMDEFLPENPLVVGVDFPGITPAKGITFIANNIKRQFYLVQSHDDNPGSLLLVEF